MHSTLPTSIEGLLAERDRLENLLHVSEEWRALCQLRARTERGEKLTSVSEGQLEELLLDTLASNPFYKRRTAVLAALEQLNETGSAPAGSSAAQQASAVDDLKRIRRIDAALERRLHAMNISSFEQIAQWTSSDVQNIASTLGLGKRISAENWIEQAALFASAKRPAAAQSVVTPKTQANISTVPIAILSPAPQSVETEVRHKLISEITSAEPPRPAPARVFAPVITPIIADEIAHLSEQSASLLESKDTEVIEANSENSEIPPAELAIAVPEAFPLDVAPHDVLPDEVTQSEQQSEAEWAKQIEVLEAQLLDIAYGPDNEPTVAAALDPEATTRISTAVFPNTAEIEIRAARAAGPLNGHNTPAPQEPTPQPSALENRLSGLLGREDYVAFRSSVEEATVEIVRSRENGAPPSKAPPLLPASGNAQPPAYPWPLEEPRDDSEPDAHLARFSKALTGR